MRKECLIFMSGLEKIVEQIISEAKTTAKKIIDEANTEAAQISQAAKAESEKEAARLLADAAKNAETAQKLADSAAEMDARRTLLAAKQQLIGSVIEEAKTALTALPDDEYFAMILRLAKKNALPQEGELFLSQKDLDRLPVGFEERLNEALAPQGALLHISKQTRQLDGGFLLVYGGIEENCSFSALFDAQREALQDQVHKILFA